MELWHDYTFYSFILLSSERNEPFGLPFFINPSVSACHLPYILRCITQGRRVRVTLRLLQCDAPHTGHGRGRRVNTNDFLYLSKKVLVTLIRFICSFFSAARRTNQEAPPQLSGFWLVATVAVGVCGTRSARTVLALFPPSSLRLHRPIKAESGVLLVF